MRDLLSSHLIEHGTVFAALVADTGLLDRLLEAGRIAGESVARGGKVMFCGNGGSAADAQHFAAELTVRLEKDRAPLAGISLCTDVSLLTACSNDYSFEDVFARQIEALGKKGDVLVAISTSGNSPNVLKAARTAKLKGISVLAFTGAKGGKIGECCDVLLNVPAERTMRVQELHAVILHIWCDLLERYACAVD
ncbi:MAG: D-sedoheptulose 7-phosphate isomerase [Planctomycetota bacterium]